MENVWPVLLIQHGTVSTANADVIHRSGAWVSLSVYGMTQLKNAIARVDSRGLTEYVLRLDFMMDNL